MIRFLTLNQLLIIYRKVIEQTSGSPGVRDHSALVSALAQPRMTFEGKDLYPTIVEKAAALGYSLIQNHPFIDGNKRVGHAAMEVFLILNGYEIEASVDDQEKIIIQLASGNITRNDFLNWLKKHVIASHLTESQP
jgi:death-on-curing protein